MSLHTVASRLVHGLANRIHQAPASPARQHVVERPSRLQHLLGGALGGLAAVKAELPQLFGRHPAFAPPPVPHAAPRVRRFGPLTPPPLALQQYVRLERPSPRFTRYLQTLERQVGADSLERFSPAISRRNFLEKGHSKDYYACGQHHVLALAERAGVPVAQQWMWLKMLGNAGVPVVNSRVGTVPSAFRGSPSVPAGAVVMERLDGCVNFERMNRKEREALLSSPRLNETTLNSLEAVRRALSQQQINIEGMKGGMQRDGTFVLRPPDGISRRNPRDIEVARGQANLDRLIHAVRQQLDDRQRAARRA